MPTDTLDVHFPFAGVDASRPAHKQPVREVRPGLYARSTPAAQNVRGKDARTGRLRGATRPGMTRLVRGRVCGSEWVVQELRVVVTAGSGAVQASQSGRVVRLVSVARGNVFSLVPGGTAFGAAVNETGEDPPLNFTDLVRSSACNQLLFFADGVNEAYYDAAADTVKIWTATAGTLPRDEDGNRPRLIATWRGGIMLSGLLGAPQNWFLSRRSDPFDFGYASAENDSAQAVAGNNAPQGLIGDVVTGLVPFSDDRFLFGCDSQLWMMKGDPAAGGTLDQVTKTIGMAFGEAWCLDPMGNCYFLSNKVGVYRLAPNGYPERLSGAVDKFLKDIDTGAYGVRFLWDDVNDGFDMYVTPLAEPGYTTHWTWERQTGAWFPKVHADHNMDPLCCCAFDGNGPNDRVAVVGGWDGYVRYLDDAAADDDGTPIAWHVFLGPMLTKDFDDILLKELQPVIAEGSGDVTWEVFAGATAEAALASASAGKPRAKGVWAAGRGLTAAPRVAGKAIYVRLSGTEPAAFESIRANVTSQGPTRRRQRQ